MMIVSARQDTDRDGGPRSNNRRLVKLANNLPCTWF